MTREMAERVREAQIRRLEHEPRLKSVFRRDRTGGAAAERLTRSVERERGALKDEARAKRAFARPR
ncbi:MAG TPA: hypothetical protein VE631_02285 [Alphaproteobacteria bacterium]|nr:hypothetical protein [Alphaproteobacteria bacterium]